MPYWVALLGERACLIIYWVIIQSGVPGGLVGGPLAYQDQYRGFKSHRVHARRDFFLHKKMTSGKRESVSWLLSMKVDEQWEC